MRRALIIFAKNPVKGKVKTRLAKDIGENEALSWYLRLMKKTENTVQGTCIEKTVFWSTNVPMHPPAFYSDEFNADVQQGENLGERMSGAVKSMFAKGYDSVAIIGTDCWELKTEIVEEAYQQLKTNDVVVGPAKDGGYYLMAMNQFSQELFENIPWSTEEVASKTYEACEKLGLKCGKLKALSDVDKVHDLPII